MTELIIFLIVIGGFIIWNVIGCYRIFRREELAWRVRIYRVLTRVAITFFFLSAVINPMGITIPWSWWYATYGVMLWAAIAGLVVWLAARELKKPLDLGQMTICVVLIAAYYIVSRAPIYRLRWWQ